LFFLAIHKEQKILNLPLYQSEKTSGPIFSHMAAMAKDIGKDDYTG